MSYAVRILLCLLLSSKIALRTNSELSHPQTCYVWGGGRGGRGQQMKAIRDFFLFPTFLPRTVVICTYSSSLHSRQVSLHASAETPRLLVRTTKFPHEETPVTLSTSRVQASRLFLMTNEEPIEAERDFFHCLA